MNNYPRPDQATPAAQAQKMIARGNGSCVNVASHQPNPSGDRSQSRRHAAQAAEARLGQRFPLRPEVCALEHARPKKQ